MNQIKLSKKKKLQIFPLGDIHIGSPQCNYEFLEKWKEVFKGTKSEKRIYLQGDLLDCAKKSLSNSSYKQTMSVDEQIEYFIKFIKPFKKYINGMVIGNHEARIKKEFDLDIMKIIAESLNIEYANQLYHKYHINDLEYSVFSIHSTKVSSQPHLMLGTALRSMKHIDANLYMYGHCHQGNHIKTYDVGFDGYNERTTVLTGSFLSYKGSYAEEGNYAPFPSTFPVISIGSDLTTDVKHYKSNKL